MEHLQWVNNPYALAFSIALFLYGIYKDYRKEKKKELEEKKERSDREEQTQMRILGGITGLKAELHDTNKRLGLNDAQTREALELARKNSQHIAGLWKGHEGHEKRIKKLEKKQ